MMMGFNGCHQINENVFVYDRCDDAFTISNRYWYDAENQNLKSLSKIQNQINPRMNQRQNEINFKEVKLEFTLNWFDQNQLDLNIICPCGTRLCFANN